MAKKNTALADRDGSYTPDIMDRRRIAVAELIMVAQTTGSIMAGDLLHAIKHNVTEQTELDVMGALVIKRITDIMQNGSQF